LKTIINNEDIASQCKDMAVKLVDKFGQMYNMFKNALAQIGVPKEFIKSCEQATKQAGVAMLEVAHTAASAVDAAIGLAPPWITGMGRRRLILGDVSGQQGQTGGMAVLTDSEKKDFMAAQELMRYLDAGRRAEAGRRRTGRIAAGTLVGLGLCALLSMSAYAFRRLHKGAMWPWRSGRYDTLVLLES